MQPKKELGQHWLYDKRTLEQICDYAELEPGSYVLEVGPGLGTLTEVILQSGVRVTAVEFDKDLANDLAFRLRQNINLEVENLDILKFNLNKLEPGYKVVANIPYYLTSKLIRTFCESTNPPQQAVLLVQKEVAERVCAKPGHMSLLSVSTQVYFHASLGETVQANMFTPPPKVDSQVLILKRRLHPLVDNEDIEEFFRVVKAGFSERRKKLRSSLSGGLRIEKSEADGLIREVGLDPVARAQELSIEQWKSLLEAFKSL